MAKQILHQLSIWIVVIPFLVGIINFRSLNRDSRWIFLLVSVALVPQLMTAFVVNDKGIFNIAYNLYTPIEFFILFYLFKAKFRNRTGQFGVLASAAIYLVVMLLFFSRHGVQERFIGELVAVNNVIYMIWILAIFKQEFSEETTFIEISQPFSWYLIALILYAPCTIITLSLYHYIRNPETPIFRDLVIIQDIFNILLYILFAIGLFIRSRENSSGVVQS
ncbi:MAG: hypothetical protein WBP58_15390 [Chitinophagaceae bacterium]